MLRLLLTCLILAACAPAAPEATRFDFEGGLPAKAAAKGDVTVVDQPVHGGAKAVRVGKGGELLLPVAEADGFGTVSLWAYDSGFKLTGDAAKQRAYGPLWGLGNAAGQRLVFGLVYAPYLGGNDSYGWVSTAENGWGSRRFARVSRAPGWHHWVFTVNNETDVQVTVDGKPASAFDVGTSKFFHGFNAVYLRGGDLDEPVLVDDVEVSWQPAALTERTRPLPGETRKPPAVAPLPLLPAVAGQHPRLFFTAADVPGIRARMKSLPLDFGQRLLSGANSYLGQLPPAGVTNDQDMQQWGWWRLSTLAFAYVATGERKYGDKAIEWLQVLCAYPDWGAGEELNQSMGAANFLAGIACAYDWCYELMTDAQRKTVRDKLQRQVCELCWAGFLDPKTAGYWKNDHQNNHRHHRLAGLTLGTLAIAGEAPEAEAYAAFAAADAKQVAEALPPDGSNHEGPTYMPFGFSYVVLTLEALRRCTGVDLYGAPGLRNMVWFRAHVLQPGLHSAFNFGDSGAGPEGAATGYFNHYLWRLAAEYRDAPAQAFLTAAYQAEPESFLYFPWDILWYDPTLRPGSLDAVPRWRYFEDLELAAYRSSWTDPNSLAVILKCGPYGGHRMNQLRQGNAYVNVAHDHPDANHFQFFWAGHQWVSDDGYPKREKAGKNHNLVLVDGKGPLAREGGWLQPIPNMGELGKVDHVTCADGLFAARGDASKYYPAVKTAWRWLAVVQDRAVVVVDHLVANQPHTYDWLLHSNATLTPDGDSALTMVKGGETMHLRFAGPVKLALAKDELEGHDRGTRLTVSAGPAASARFVAVFCREPLAVTAEETPQAITVKLAGLATLAYDLATGEVRRIP